MAILTTEDFKKISETVIANLEHKEQYVALCKAYNDYGNSRELIKKEVDTNLKDKKLDFKIAGSERLIYKDYDLNGLKARFIIEYRYNIIICSYRFSGDKIESPASFFFRQIVQAVVGDTTDYKYKFPKIKSVEEFEVVLQEILRIHETLNELFLLQIKKYFENIS